MPLRGPGTIRKLERRLVLSGEYGIKAVYASLIGLGTAGAYDPDAPTRELVVAGWADSIAKDPRLSGLSVAAALDRGYMLLRVPRYAPYQDALLALSEHAGSVRVAEVNGNGIVTVTGLAPTGWVAPARATVITAYPALDDASRQRVLVSIPARDVLDVLAFECALGAKGLAVDHIYDY